MEQFQTEFFKEDVPRPPQSFFFFFWQRREGQHWNLYTHESWSPVEFQALMIIVPI
jgi:hypothetical protein